MSTSYSIGLGKGVPDLREKALEFSLLLSKVQKIMDFFLNESILEIGEYCNYCSHWGLGNKNDALFYLIIRKSVSTLNTSFYNCECCYELSCKIKRHP